MRKLIIATATVGLLAGCTTDPFTGEAKLSNTAGGAMLGAGAGALVGLAVGPGGDGNRTAALIGAGVGALAGGAIGSYMDSQESELRAQLQGSGVSVTRRGENIILNMPSNVTFATDQDAISTRFYPTLNSVALVLQKYNRTLVDVNGFTDSTGGDRYNLELSQSRALSVAQYLNAQGIDRRRFSVMGFGKDQPVASNATVDGRAANRRVEIQLVPLR